ncbi:unnamed protein product [Cyprideis torosa]|uniref:Uncharacterized protein n=1 Tax=Cyprideis torosa TaxID=163714 RepID=A0A7R8WEK2_9CRUS|nr:unnamed protein product [Cyprideis torosa]CAG0895890.1 unnamed protein product [Cyprideis torosa]
MVDGGQSQVDAAALRREARRRKILMNAEARLERLTKKQTRTAEEKTDEQAQAFEAAVEEFKDGISKDESSSSTSMATETESSEDKLEIRQRRPAILTSASPPIEEGILVGPQEIVATEMVQSIPQRFPELVLPRALLMLLLAFLVRLFCSTSLAKERHGTEENEDGLKDHERKAGRSEKEERTRTDIGMEAGPACNALAIVAERSIAEESIFANRRVLAWRIAYRCAYSSFLPALILPLGLADFSLLPELPSSCAIPVLPPASKPTGSEGLALRLGNHLPASSVGNGGNGRGSAPRVPQENLKHGNEMI